MVAGSISTLIFDLDGTILYTLEDLTDSCNYALTALGYDIHTMDEIRSFVGNGVELLIERILPDGQNNPDLNMCMNLFKEHYSNNMFNKTKPYDGIIEMLNKLKQENYKIAVVSNKFDSAVKKLVSYYFDNLVDVSVGQLENTSVKPSPDTVYKIMSELGVKPDECIFIGDSEVDIETAKNSGIPCLSVVWGYKDIDFLYKNGATTMIYAPEDILEIV